MFSSRSFENVMRQWSTELSENLKFAELLPTRFWQIFVDLISLIPRPAEVFAQ